ncbi:TetR/AcrR family transcriptional regulator [Nocardiopsis sp. HNM0947]|uniref:TetR/AcrR family transcriptional regulator n=2 Tax=Nocardiopsis coralli TaxID=2772213 RepID=A0ABR9PCX9_9ACTN|nr:TetR/AcrR family transcriptional regulator [Nocardiopsis coralli]
MADQPVAERADAARNRHKILEAASRILAESGPEGLRMEEVASAAGVGVGTLYRRFGGQAGLAYALLDEKERELQTAVMTGPPPLGPGADPFPRLRAFLRELLHRVAHQGKLLVTAEMNRPHARFAGAYGVHHAHVSGLLRLARPDLDDRVMADALLAPLSATLVTYELEVGEHSLDGIEAVLDALVDGLEACAPR